MGQVNVLDSLAVLVADRIERPSINRLAFSKEEAAGALGVSIDFFDQHVAPELRIVRRGRRRLIPVAELERWLDASAALTIGDHQ